MSIENEIKVRIEDLNGFLRKLSDLAPLVTSKRHFEDNYILDDPKHSLAARQSLVRVRITPQGAWLTFKGPPHMAGLFKRREELETALDDGHAALAILRQIGLRVCFRYQKYRREFNIAVGPLPGNAVHVALDETPIGVFAEFEGSETDIKNIARKMRFSRSRFLRDSYASLYIQYCSERRQPVRHMIFRPVGHPKAGGTKRKAQP